MCGHQGAKCGLNALEFVLAVKALLGSCVTLTHKDIGWGAGQFMSLEAQEPGFEAAITATSNHTLEPRRHTWHTSSGTIRGHHRTSAQAPALPNYQLPIQPPAVPKARPRTFMERARLATVSWRSLLSCQGVSSGSCCCAPAGRPASGQGSIGYLRLGQHCCPQLAGLCHGLVMMMQGAGYAYSRPPAASWQLRWLGGLRSGGLGQQRI